ncbi:MAG: thiamine pyrophosphate-dependent enzyme [Candidatus Tectimicrobiota bacterium]
MHRQDVIRIVLEAVDSETVIVSNIADASFELCMLGDRQRNFYMLGSFGLAPSIGLGVALSRKERVVVINGDGALLINLGCLATEGRYRPGNLLHIVVDNAAHGATGYQPTATSVGCDLAAVAQGCGLRAKTVHDTATLKQALVEALASEGPEVIVAKVDERPPVAAPHPPHTGPEIRDRFMAALQES